jgi:hypothetical protein
LLVVGLSCLVLAFYFSSASLVLAGQSATGELLFYPCTSCHPVEAGKPPAKLPNGFKGHQIKLLAHDNLGQGSTACLVCHDDPAKDPAKLKLIDGGLIDIKDDAGVSKVCYRCHSDKYKEFEAGIHGKHQAKCTSSGCHDPHTPAWIYSEPLLPFVGTGFQVRAVSDRVPFIPLASAPVAPPVTTPWWLSLAAGLGLIASVGIAGTLTLGRLKR